MEIRWGNIFGILMVIFLIYLFFKAKPAIERFFDNFGSTPSRLDPGVLVEMIVGIIVIGAVAVLLNRK